MVRKASVHGSRLSAGRAQCAAGRRRRSGQIFGQLSRLVEAHRRGRHDPRLRANLPAKFQKLRNPHGNVVGSLEPCAIAGPLARHRRRKQVVYRAAQPRIALHQPQHAGPQLLQRLHHFVAEGCPVRGDRRRSAPGPHRPAAPCRQLTLKPASTAAGGTRNLVGIELQAESCPRSRQFHVRIEITPQSRRQPSHMHMQHR